MASIINASTAGAGGLISTADNSGELRIQTGGTNAITIDTSQEVGIGITTPLTRLHVVQNFGNSYAANLYASAAGNAQGQLAGISLAPTFVGTADNGARRAADIWSGFNGGSWGTQYLAFGVGNAQNDTGTVTPERMRIDSVGQITNTYNGGAIGLVQGQHYFRLNTNVAGANVNTAQSVFGVGVTLLANTVYEFEINYTLTKTAGTTPHAASILFGGTATINNILYGGVSISVPSSMPITINSAYASNLASINSVSASALYSGSVSTLLVTVLNLKGTVSINTGGTFIPQYILSAAPGGAFTTLAGSYMKFTPIGAAGSNINVGGFA